MALAVAKTHAQRSLYIHRYAHLRQHLTQPRFLLVLPHSSCALNNHVRPLILGSLIGNRPFSSLC